MNAKFHHRLISYACVLFVLSGAAQTETVTITCTGAGGSFASGSVNAAGTKNDGNMITVRDGGNRGWACFSLASIPPLATVTSVTANFTTYSSAQSSAFNNIYGFTGDPASTPGGTLFTNCGSGTTFNASSWTASALQTKVLTAAGIAFVQANLGGTINLGYVRGSTNVYNIGGYPGDLAAAPSIVVTYTGGSPCAGTPNAGVTVASVSQGCGSIPSSDLSLSGATTDNGLNYQWQFDNGGGYTDFGSNQATQSVITVSTTTSYRCIVTCIHGGASATSTPGTLSVYPVVTASASAAPAGVVCGGTPVTLTATGGLTYAWFPAAGLNATNVASPTSTVNTTTTYTVMATGPGGCSDVATATVSVNPTPAFSSVSATSNPICMNGNTQLYAEAGIPMAANLMTFSTGTNELDPMVGATTVLGPGNDNSTSALQSIGFDFYFNGAGLTQWSCTPDGFIRLGSSVAVGASNSLLGTANFPLVCPYWDEMTTGTTGDVTAITTGTAPNRILKVQWFVTIPWNPTGPANSSFQCWLYEGSNAIEFRYGSMATATMSATVGIAASTSNFQSVTLAGPIVSTSTAYDSNAGQPAPGAMYSFKNSGSTYSWSPTTFLMGSNVPSPLVMSFNVASQAYTVTASNGPCSATGTVTVSTSGPATAATITGNLGFCAGGSTTLTAVPADGGNPYTYLWAPGGQTTKSISVNVPGTYSCEVDNCGGSVNTGNVSVVQHPLATVAISPTSASYCTGNAPVVLTASGANTYAWTPAAGLSATTGTSVNATPSMSTIYIVMGTDANGCQNSATRVVTYNGVAPTITSTTASPDTICPGGTSQLQVGLIAPVYCEPPPSVGTGFGDYISNVKIDTTTLNSSSGASASPYYTIFPASGSTTATLTVGAAYALKVVAGTSNSSVQLAGWIDYNQDGVFSEPGEKLGELDILGPSPAIGTIPFTVPVGALNGPTRFRVCVADGFGLATPVPVCSGVPYGEYEDYTVTITGGVARIYAWTPGGALNNAAIANPMASITTPGTTTYTVSVTLGACTSTGTTSVTLPTTDDGDPCTLELCFGEGNAIHLFQDMDSDGVCDVNDNCPNFPGQVGSPCDDGNSGTFNDVVSGTCMCMGTLVPRVSVKVFLEGPYNSGTGLMNDALRSLGTFPLTDPYPALGYTHTGIGNGGSVALATLSGMGNNAIVDWVLLELRSSAAPASIVASRSALVQSDGDVVELDGFSPVAFAVVANNYYLAIRQRNHLGCMTANPVALGPTTAAVDFTTNATATYGTAARKSVTGTFPAAVLWAGDVSFNGAIKYTGSSNDRDPILVLVGSTTPNNTITGQYTTRDVNMNGQVKYTGSGNDRDPILVNVGSTTPNNVRTQQLP